MTFHPEYQITEQDGYKEIKPTPKKKRSKKGAAKASTQLKPSGKAEEEGSSPSSSTKKYTIRYGILPATDISDSVIVANPLYGTPIGKWGSRPVTPDGCKMNRLRGFYAQLEQSIKEEGILNPIFCNCFKEGTFSRYGTSRLWIAKKLQLSLPCIIADYTGEWSHLEELKTEEEVLSKFKSKPEILEMDDDSMRFDGCSHFHV